MRLTKNSSVIKGLVKHGKNYEINNFLDAKISLPIGLNEVKPTSEDDCKEIEEYARNIYNSGLHMTKDEALLFTCITSLCPELLASEFSGLLHEIVNASHVFHKGETERNPYYSAITIKEKTYGKFTVKKSYFDKYELFLQDIPRNFNGVYIPSIGVFDYKFSYPMVSEDSKVWMSITPNEILSMKNSIAHAHGSVLTLGCGLGYFAYMVSEKENVDCVTIIEKEKDILQFFENEILPQFNHPDKIKLIHADAFDYMKDLHDKKYTFCFVDIWKSPLDVDTYVKLRRICKKFREMVVEYWIEMSFLYNLSKTIYLLMNDQFRNQNFYEKFLNQDQNSADLVRISKEITSNRRITTSKEVDTLLDLENIKGMI